MVKFAYFCIIDSLVVLQMVKLSSLKMLYRDIIIFFSIKYIYKRVKVIRKNIEKTCQMNRNKDIEISKENIEII